MNKWTLRFVDQELEEKYNRQEILSVSVRLNHINISMAITGIISIIFWIMKENWLMSAISVLFILYPPFIYYVVVYKKRFQEFIPLVINALSISTSGSQLILTFQILDITDQEQKIMEDILMLIFLILQIQNSFTLNTCQFLLYIVVKIYVKIKVDFTLLSLLLIIYSFIFIKNDYERIRNQRNIFLLQEYNNNQLKMLQNLQSPILVLEFQEKTQRLVEYFINKAFMKKIQNISPIDFIKNCYIDRKDALYTILGKKIQQFGTLQQLKVKFNNQIYLVSSEIYKGQKILVSLEFQEYKTKNFQAKPYFYNSLLKYLSKNDLQQYFKEVMKNLCGFLLYHPGKIFLKVQRIEINNIIKLVNPMITQTNTTQEYIQSNDQLLVLFFFLMKKNNFLQKLSILLDHVGPQRLFKFKIEGYYWDNTQIERKGKAKLKILKQIIKLLGLDDFSYTENVCQFTLIDVEDRFIEL